MTWHTGLKSKYRKKTEQLDTGKGLLDGKSLGAYRFGINLHFYKVFLARMVSNFPTFYKLPG